MRKHPPRFGGRAAHRYWVLRALEATDDGRSTKQEACKWVFPRMKPELGPRDYEIVATGEPRWQNELAWACDDLVRKGFLMSAMPRDVWEITDAGRAWLKA